MEYSEVYEKADALRKNLEKVIRGKSDKIELAVAALLARGHLLIEDVPGVGKTTLAHAMARSVNCSFQRIQFTSDMLPSDVIGVTVYNQERRVFEFKPGPIFANIVLADEINRTTPRTQSALLEAMNDRQISVDGITHPLPVPFMLIATQNPLEYAGTFPLPESQLDRFTISIKIGYPDAEHEREIIRSASSSTALTSLDPVITTDELGAMQECVGRVRVADDLVSYILSIANAARNHNGIRLGPSPRATSTLYATAQALAVINGRDYLLPDDIKRLAVPVFGHRIIAVENYSGEAVEAGAELVEDVLNSTPVPV
ncbi:MAG: MoxR family ATPase [Deltaproteobacteria bacterium]|nr:MoxR family ATPase [Deltaproteobacteria bacterium]